MRNLLTLDEGEELSKSLEVAQGLIWSLTDKELSEEFRIARARAIERLLLHTLKGIDENFGDK